MDSPQNAPRAPPSAQRRRPRRFLSKQQAAAQLPLPPHRVVLSGGAAAAASSSGSPMVSADLVAQFKERNDIAAQACRTVHDLHHEEPLPVTARSPRQSHMLEGVTGHDLIAKYYEDVALAKKRRQWRRSHEATMHRLTPRGTIKRLVAEFESQVALGGGVWTLSRAPDRNPVPPPPPAALAGGRRPAAYVAKAASATERIPRPPTASRPAGGGGSNASHAGGGLDLVPCDFAPIFSTRKGQIDRAIFDALPSDVQQRIRQKQRPATATPFSILVQAKKNGSDTNK